MIKKYSKEKRKLVTEAMELLHLKRRIYEARLRCMKHGKGN